MPGSRMFQVWFDPNIKKSMLKEATYNDCKSADMNYAEEDGIFYKNYVGNGGPMQMDSEGVEIKEITLSSGDHQLELAEKKIYSLYLLNGQASIEGTDLKEHDFIRIEDQKELNLVVNSDTRFFKIVAPKQLTYKTYRELVNY